MQHHEEDHQVRRPPVHVADDEAGRNDELQVLHRPIRAVGARHVVEHQQHTRDGEDQEQVERDQAQAQGRARLQRVAVHLGGLHVQQETGYHGLRPFQVALRQADAEDRAPDQRAPKPVPESLGQGSVHTTRHLSAATRSVLSTSRRLSLLNVTRNHSSGRGAGPPRTWPSLLNMVPWHGQW